MRSLAPPSPPFYGSACDGPLPYFLFWTPETQKTINGPFMTEEEFCLGLVERVRQIRTDNNQHMARVKWFQKHLLASWSSALLLSPNSFTSLTERSLSTSLRLPPFVRHSVRKMKSRVYGVRNPRLRSVKTPILRRILSRSWMELRYVGLKLQLRERW
jgi:hypothetical protein